jgi:predicted nucleic acid-binding protein
VREGTLPRRERDHYWAQFRLDWASQYQVVELTARIYVVADHLTFAYPLRSLDALQLACALAAVRRLTRRRLTFMTADGQQARAAEREGLVVELIG